MLAFCVICVFAGACLGIAICSPLVSRAWQRGVKEGYAYGRGERTTEFAEAGAYLRDHCWGQWPELRDDNKLRVHRITAFHEKWEDN